MSNHEKLQELYGLASPGSSKLRQAIYTVTQIRIQNSLKFSGMWDKIENYVEKKVQEGTMQVLQGISNDPELMGKLLDGLLTYLKSKL